jgi:hypothetical protein
MTMTIESTTELTIDVLSIARGDMRMTFKTDTPEGLAEAAIAIDRMLRAGYTIFVETEEGQRRVQKYDPTHNEYILVDSGPVVDEELRDAPAKKAPAKRAAAGTRARAVGASAGG